MGSYLGGSSFLRIPSSWQGVSDPQEEGAETSAEGPGGRTGRSGTWDPWALPGCRDADLTGKGPLCKALVNPQSLSPDPLTASAGFAETGRGGCATAGATRPLSALPRPRALASFHSLVSCPGQAKEGSAGVGWGINTCARWEEDTPRRGAWQLMPPLTLTPMCPIAMLLKLGWASESHRRHVKSQTSGPKLQT